MNRYTRRGVRAQYNPVSFEQFAQAPLMAQQLHDQTIASAMAQQEYLKNLPWHEEEARKIEGELESQIDSLTNKITSSERGIYDVDGVKELSNIRSYKREKFAPAKSRIETALQNRTDLKKRYQDLVDKGDATSREMQEALAIFDRQSADAAKKGTIGYDGRVLAMDPGINKMIVDYISKLPADKIYQETGWVVDKNRGVWVNQSTKEESNGMPQELKSYAMNYIMQDPKAMAYFNDRAMVAEELYSQKDEMGNIIYNNQYYNPDQFRNEIIKEQIDRASSVAEPFSYRNLEIKENIKNLSDWQLDEFGLTDTELHDMYVAAGEPIPTDFTLDKQIKRVFKDADGNVLSADKIDDYLKRSINIENLTPEEKAKLNTETIPKLRKMLAAMVQESPNMISRDFNMLTNDLSAVWKAGVNKLFLEPLGFERNDNYEGVIHDALTLMFEDGVTSPRLSSEDREILRQQTRTKLTKHNVKEKDFVLGSNIEIDKLEGEKAEGVYSQAFDQVSTPQINGYAIKESTYIDPNTQEAIRSNNLASFLEANSLMVVNENNETLYGEDAREWIKDHMDVQNIGSPKMIHSGVKDEFLLGTGVTITTNDNKIGQIIVPTNSKNIAARAQLLTPLNQISMDRNMTLGEGHKSVPFRDGIQLEYINTVQNGRAVQLIKPYRIDEKGVEKYFKDEKGVEKYFKDEKGVEKYFKDEKGVKKYFKDEKDKSKVAIYGAAEFRRKFVDPYIEQYVQTGESLK